MDLVSLQSTSAHTAMHCRSFRDDDILKRPEQFCSLYISRTYTKESYVAEDSTGMVELEDTTILPFGACLLSECGVIAISLYPTCTTTMFFACPIKPAGCIFPYETRGMLDICNGILEVFLWPAMLPVCHHWPPALWGDLALSPSRLRGCGGQIW